MVIFIAGFAGTGKTSLGKALSERLGMFHYDVDEAKKIIYREDPEFENNFNNSIPFSDETRTKVYSKVAEDFPSLAKKYKHIIVEEVLHRKNLRQILFDSAEKYFGGYVIVWVKTDDKIIKERLGEKREGHLLEKNAIGMYLSLKEQHQDFDEVDITLENNGSMEDAVAKLYKFVNDKIV